MSKHGSQRARQRVGIQNPHPVRLYAESMFVFNGTGNCITVLNIPSWLLDEYRELKKITDVAAKKRAKND